MLHISEFNSELNLLEPEQHVFLVYWHCTKNSIWAKLNRITTKKPPKSWWIYELYLAYGEALVNSQQYFIDYSQIFDWICGSSHNKMLFLHSHTASRPDEWSCRCTAVRRQRCTEEGWLHMLNRGRRWMDCIHKVRRNGGEKGVRIKEWRGGDGRIEGEEDGEQRWTWWMRVFFYSRPLIRPCNMMSSSESSCI